MSKLEASPAEMRDAVTAIEAKADTLAQRLQNLDATVGNELLIDGWQGTAASAYDESWVEWRNGAENIIGALHDLAQLLRAAADDYEQTDDDTSVAVSNATRSGIAI
ncbi:WXG100 family type VII secretion target [Rhodococcoides fascians]|uniref:WXG100 family type VII secretion target n=1 Tax=Rhodococcoides fascians TaxID=1828 RepID=UPI002ACD8970|nr:WXG100 family type VII secretion target [Rhodococcus fascians]WQH28661.1 WXG100 family type VII secretion target [Rhodococcus fascians]